MRNDSAGVFNIKGIFFYKSCKFVDKSPFYKYPVETIKSVCYGHRNNCSRYLLLFSFYVII